ncbi:MAG TPA: hypothetical protein VM240_00170 [Verrucomicrobiae bacterium]|nr:hypothetical protein [Verrucomicrobiae bacterium]
MSAQPDIGVPRAGLWAAFGSLALSSGTLVCCVLPAVMVTLGAGAALAGIVTAVPQLIWLSAHKGLVFGVAGAGLALSGWMLWRARSLPCPADPKLAAACARTRRASVVIYWVGVGFCGLGVLFAFVLPALNLF